MAHELTVFTLDETENLITGGNHGFLWLKFPPRETTDFEIQYNEIMKQ